MQRHHRGEPFTGEDGRHDLRGEAAVRRQHRVERRLVEGRSTVGLDDLASPCQLTNDRLCAEIDRALLAERADPGGERLVRDRKRVHAGHVLPQRDAARSRLAQKAFQDGVDLGQDPRVIIDAHLHVDDVPALGWSLEAAYCVRRLDEAGIDRGVVMTIVDAPEVNPNALELVAEACAAYPGRLEAFARIHPWYGDRSLELLDRAIGDLGFKGLKLHPVSTIAHPGGEETLRLIRRAAEHSAPTLFHCGDEPLTTPLTIAHAAAACPEATIILGHMGGYVHADEAIDVAERFRNLVLETSAMPYPAKVRAAVERLGPERVLYASDGPACSPRIELEKVRLAGLDPAAERLVTGGNAERILAAVA